MKRQNPIVTGVSAFFTVEHNTVKLELRIMSEKFSEILYGFEVLPGEQTPPWDRVKGVEAPETWKFREVDTGVQFFTTRPVTRGQLTFTFEVNEKVSQSILLRLINKNHQPIGVVMSEKKPAPFKIDIEAIQFNHDTSSLRNDAMNIRRNMKTEVITPEWKKGANRPEDSPAAYALDETKGESITIKAKFTLTPYPTGQFHIKAEDGGVLGALASRVVKFKNGISQPEFVSFKLKSHTIGKSGIQKEDIQWKWKYRAVGEKEWHDMRTTAHRIYIVLREPGEPWKQQPFPDNQNPWTAVLEYACTWALNEKDADTASGKVTAAVNSVPGIKYDIVRGSTNYAFGSQVDLSKFLERLEGGTGLGEKVNCTDCAAMVSTFSNIVGCRLWQSRMGSTFRCNKVVVIGYTNWAVPFDWGFSYHEVAWKDECSEKDPLFDACLEVDGDDDPTSPPHVPLLPVDIPFFIPGSVKYKERLVAPISRPYCKPLSGTRKRRVVR